MRTTKGKGKALQAQSGCDNPGQMMAIADAHFGQKHGINESIKATREESGDPDETDAEESDANSFGELNLGLEADADDVDDDSDDEKDEGDKAPKHTPSSSNITNDPVDISKARTP
ncbi:hypothetical protein N9L68_08400 [bacterium]|nr:hypothetical protein [bacterium]